jgi:hypothetical protein
MTYSLRCASGARIGLLAVLTIHTCISSALANEVSVPGGTRKTIAANLLVPNKGEVENIDSEVADKLHAMHKLLNGVHSEVGKTDRLRAAAVREKFDILTTIINSLTQQKDQLFTQNLELKKEMKATVAKLNIVKTQLKAAAERADDNDYRLWLGLKAKEITTFYTVGWQSWSP